MNELQFTEDWFTLHTPMWVQHVLPRLTRHPARFLEIGTFEGRSTCWLLQNALTSPHDRITCIDPFGTYEGCDDSGAPFSYGHYEEVFDANMRAVEAGARLDKRKGLSHEVLRTLPLGSYDGCYIDGSHAARDVLRDAVLCFDLIRVGGFLLLDDYGFAPKPDQVVAEAIDAFLWLYRSDLKLVFKNWQVLVERVQ